jgi:hypothetical protein
MSAVLLDVCNDISDATLIAVAVLAIMLATMISRRLLSMRRRSQPAGHRPRNGRRSGAPRAEFINAGECPDCVWMYAGSPVSWPCPVHTQPVPGDDLDLWDAELRQTRRLLRRRDREDEMR